MLEKIFGFKKADTTYKDRTGAYGIGFSADGKIPIVRVPRYHGDNGYFLLGGGIEGHETPADCIIRESLEEAGLSVIPKELVCKGEYYQFIERTKIDFHSIGYFYYMEIGTIVSVPTEPDHTLVWLTYDEAKEKLFCLIKSGRWNRYIVFTEDEHY